MNSTSEQFDKVIAKCRSLFEKKLHDYGTAWRIFRLPAITDQLFIKAQRIRSLQQNEMKMIDEDETSEFIAIINYAVIALIQLEKGPVTYPDMSPEDALLEYDRQIEITKNLLMAKNHDYGEAWRDMRIVSLTDIILQKLFRVKQMEDLNGKTLVSEGVDANYQDMLNYAVFALIHKNFDH